MGQTMVEKTFSKKNITGKPVKAGELVTAKIDGAMLLMPFDSVQKHMIESGIKEGLTRVWDREKVYFVMDHFQPATNSLVAERNRVGREVARKLNFKYFYDSMPAVGHQVMCDKGYVRPGELCIGIDSHATIYGGLNCIGTGIGEADMAYALMFGELWFQVPQTIKINLTGSPRNYPFAKEILLYIAGKYGDDFLQYKAVEYTGEYVKSMSIADRLCLACQTVDIGGKFGLFEYDDKVKEYLKDKTNVPYEPVFADPDAEYEQVININVDEIPFVVAKPHRLNNVVDVDEVKNVKIDQAVIGACSNGRFEDIEIAAKMLKGKKINPNVRFFIQPASWDVYRQCLDAGFITTILDSGAYFLEPGCGACQPVKGCLSAGEVCITATTRNYKGRLGDPGAFIYLGGPATVTAAALAGEIVNPKEALNDIL